MMGDKHCLELIPPEDISSTSQPNPTSKIQELIIDNTLINRAYHQRQSKIQKSWINKIYKALPPNQIQNPKSKNQK